MVAGACNEIIALYFATVWKSVCWGQKDETWGIRTRWPASEAMRPKHQVSDRVISHFGAGGFPPFRQISKKQVPFGKLRAGFRLRCASLRM